MAHLAHLAQISNSISQKYLTTRLSYNDFDGATTTTGAIASFCNLRANTYCHGIERTMKASPKQTQMFWFSSS